MSSRVKFAAMTVIAGAALMLPPRQVVHGQSAARTITASSGADLRTWDARVDRMIRDGDLTLRERLADPLVPGRSHERYIQTVNRVPVYGADIARQLDSSALTVSIFGMVYEDVDIDTTATLSPEDAQKIVEARSGVLLGTDRHPTLTILPKDEGGYALVYQARAATEDDVTLYFVDAGSGAIVTSRSDMQTQTAAVGVGFGVLGDRKKVSASTLAGAFVESDLLRPPLVNTYDMRGDLTRILSILNGLVQPASSDLATDTDNDWTDGANVDAHVYEGYTYDYYFKRFGRRGLNDRDIRIRGFVHPVNRNDIFSASGGIIGSFYLNAFYVPGASVVVFGEGLPPGLVTAGARQYWNYLAGALDVVSHELTHGVTEFTSNLVYRNEPGALNEAFSDMMGTSVEFFFQPAGSGALRADYFLGEDVVSAGSGTPFPAGLRSMATPGLFGDPDHYSRRFTGTGDNGGVHINSGIPNNAFYLSIEGGTNATSGLSVQGVGAANRERMEKVWYRAFTQLMPSNATFAVARRVSIQAAQDLYGAGSAEERAVTQAWTAVGVL